MQLKSISQLPRSIAAVSGQPPPAPRKVYDLVIRGIIPANYQAGRGYFNEADVPAIVAVLGLAPTATDPSK